MKDLNIYMCGVGGQGIGLLAEVLTQVCLKAGYNVKAVDTHGLAQRGGTVVSHLRIGNKLFSPLVPLGEADIVISLERLEAVRAMVEMLKNGGTVIYYDVAYQPIHVRLGKADYPGIEKLNDLAAGKNVKVCRVFYENLPDPRMQNVVLLSEIARKNLIEGVSETVVEKTLKEILPQHIAGKNIDLFHSLGDN